VARSGSGARVVGQHERGAVACVARQAAIVAQDGMEMAQAMATS
jgi:hypothetical protein